MEKLKANLFLAFTLMATSTVIYLVQGSLFNRPSETAFYLLQDLAFVPIQALIVTLVINRFLDIAEKRKRIKKVNVVISTFFVDSGFDIMLALSDFNRNHVKTCDLLNIDEITRKHETQVNQLIDGFRYDMYADPAALDGLKAVMAGRRGFMLNLLENPNLLEHESFTDMLWAVFHLGDELTSRGDLSLLSEPVVAHISNDMLRAYTAMVKEWVKYLVYLRDEYPFLYEAAKKKNPFRRSSA